ncbi:hypothetical protein [Saccharopolyspora sp. NPDC049357]|uniref:hypothetical protein n=1 Tax=Saccharopolyspora sp. NPDC049357 TaxID=3154507 RepID=UPI00341C6C5A
MSRIEQLIQDLLNEVMSEQDPPPEAASSALALAAAAVQLAKSALQQDLTGAVVLRMAPSPQTVLASAELSGTLLDLIAQLVRVLDPLVWALDGQALVAQPTRPGETGNARAVLLKRHAANALNSIGAELTDGTTPWMVAQLRLLAEVEVRKDDEWH